MCGLAGILDRDGNGVSPPVLEAMTRSLVHRGPDDEGFFREQGIGLGHRRLSIIDLSAAGRQPMVSADGRYVLAYNGEVYDFRELRRELEREGVRFRSRCDTEVVLEALALWGHAALERFNGMFALALWDRKTRELLLARDRYGIKPLYYTWRGNTLLFGSEVKALLAHPDVSPAMDREALVEYFTFQNLFTDRTLFDGVRLLPAGTRMVVRPDGPAEQTRWWDFSFEEPAGPVDEPEYLEELDRLLVQAVHRQLVSDVQVGSYLSSGMDSGTVTALARQKIPDLRTFTVGFDMHTVSGLELAFDEREQAEHLAGVLGTEHYEVILKGGDIERCLPDLTLHLEDPRVGQSYPNWYAARLASRFCKVVLGGAGGDELFGGYPWRYYRAVVNRDFDDYIDKYYVYWQRLIPNRSIWEVFAPIKSSVEHVWTRDIFRDVFPPDCDAPRTPEDYINDSLYFEAKTFLHGLLLVEDKLSMAYGLESRVPFLDNDLVDFAMRVPAKLKLGNLGEVVRLNENEPGPKTRRYFDKTHDGKLLLRKAMARHIPRAVTEGVKQGFSGPDGSWFRSQSLEYVSQRLLEGDAALYEFMDRETIRDLVREHLDGVKNRRLFLWSLLSVEEWCRTFLEGKPGPEIETTRSSTLRTTT